MFCWCMLYNTMIFEFMFNKRNAWLQVMSLYSLTSRNSLKKIWGTNIICLSWHMIITESLKKIWYALEYILLIHVIQHDDFRVNVQWKKCLVTQQCPCIYWQVEIRWKTYESYFNNCFYVNDRIIILPMFCFPRMLPHVGYLCHYVIIH